MSASTGRRSRSIIGLLTELPVRDHRSREGALSSPSADNAQFLPCASGIESKALESTLETSLLPLLQLTSHPRSLVLLTIQALSAPPLPVLPKPIDRFDLSPGASSSCSPSSNRKCSVVPTSEKALALTASSLAAMDASSVGMTGLALGSCCALLPGGHWVLDPDYAEERAATAVFGVGWAFGAALGVENGENAGREVIWLELDGDFDEDDVRTPFQSLSRDKRFPSPQREN